MGIRATLAVMGRPHLRWVGCALGGLLAGCASMTSVQDLQQRQAAYAAAAGAPVRSFRLAPGDSVYSWEPLSDTQLVIYTWPTRAFLLDTWPCNGLTVTNGIGFTSFAGEVSVGFDRILVTRGYLPCAIRQIRPLDLARFKLARETPRHAQVMARDNKNGASPPPSPTGGN